MDPPMTKTTGSSTLDAIKQSTCIPILEELLEVIASLYDASITARYQTETYQDDRR